MKNTNKIYFLSNGPFGAEVILALAQSKFPLTLIITTPDKKAGRGQKIRELPVKVALKKTEYNHIEILSNPDLSEVLLIQKPDLVIVSDFGWIIPPEIFKLPKFGFIVTHQSLLPKYRGTTPIQTAILNGETITGVSLIEMDHEVDHGPLIAQKSVTIDEKDTAQDLLHKLALNAAELISEIIPRYLNNEIRPLRQDHAKATYTKKLAKTDGQIDWSKSATEIDRQVRAMQPWPKAFTDFQGKQLFIYQGEIKDNQYFPTKVQLEGKKIISWSDFLNGQRLTSDQALALLYKSA